MGTKDFLINKIIFTTHNYYTNTQQHKGIIKIKTKKVSEEKVAFVTSMIFWNRDYSINPLASNG